MDAWLIVVIASVLSAFVLGILSMIGPLRAMIRSPWVFLVAYALTTGGLFILLTGWL